LTPMPRSARWLSTISPSRRLRPSRSTSCTVSRSPSRMCDSAASRAGRSPAADPRWAHASDPGLWRDGLNRARGHGHPGVSGKVVVDATGGSTWSTGCGSPAMATWPLG
jgi:hypothetical protein